MFRLIYQPNRTFPEEEEEEEDEMTKQKHGEMKHRLLFLKTNVIKVYLTEGNRTR